MHKTAVHSTLLLISELHTQYKKIAQYKGVLMCFTVKLPKNLQENDNTALPNPVAIATLPFYQYIPYNLFILIWTAAKMYAYTVNGKRKSELASFHVSFKTISGIITTTN
jgi:hypothetical protein